MLFILKTCELHSLVLHFKKIKPMKKCALVVGHRKFSPGAVNKLTGMNEFLFNNQLAVDIKKAVQNVEIVIVHRKSYQDLPADINKLGPDFIISLHCNAYNQESSGTETLYYHRSKIGEPIAQILNCHIHNALGLCDRGIKPKSVEHKGGYLLRNTVAPCVISEPFFIDNDDDLKVATKNRDQLVFAYVNAIDVISQLLSH